MSVITAIKNGKRQQRVNIHLDGKYAFSLEEALVTHEGLEVGKELSPQQVEKLVNTDHYQRCLAAALNYLSYRPRSEVEIKERLYRRGFDTESITSTLEHLKELGLMDDKVFAEFWRDNRLTFRPRSRWVTGRELRQKGVQPEIINQVVAGIDDSDTAYQAAQSKLRSLSLADYEVFRRRLGDFLRRRGFSYGVANETVRRVWQEELNKHKGVTN